MKLARGIFSHHMPPHCIGSPYCPSVINPVRVIDIRVYERHFMLFDRTYPISMEIHYQENDNAISFSYGGHIVFTNATNITDKRIFYYRFKSTEKALEEQTKILVLKERLDIWWYDQRREMLKSFNKYNSSSE